MSNFVMRTRGFITEASYGRLKSAVTRLFVQQFAQITPRKTSKFYIGFPENEPVIRRAIPRHDVVLRVGDTMLLS